MSPGSRSTSPSPSASEHVIEKLTEDHITGIDRRPTDNSPDSKEKSSNEASSPQQQSNHGSKIQNHIDPADHDGDLTHSQHSTDSDHVPDDLQDVFGSDKLPQELVPRSERRGLLANLCLVRELKNPKSYSTSSKNFIVFIIAVAAVIAPMGGAIVLPALGTIADAFDTTANVINVSYGVYILSLGIFPLWWSGYSELKGRRSVYVVSFLLYVAFTIGCALSKNIASLIVFRILSGGCSAAVQAVGAGTISDIFVPTQRGRAMGYFYMGPLMGPLLAPIIGGVLDSAWGWRATQWFLIIVGGVTWLLVVFGLPETLAVKEPTLSQNTEEILDELEDPSATADPLAPVASRAQEYIPDSQDVKRVKAYLKKLNALKGKVHRSSGNTTNTTTTTAATTETSIGDDVKSIFLSPFHNIKLLRFPTVALSIAYAAYTFCTLYFLNIGIQNLYSEAPYNWNSTLTGLTYIPNSVGYAISSILNGYWTDHIIKRAVRRRGKLVPEDRLGENLYGAAVFLPAGLLIFGWCANYHTFWVFPLIGTFIFGLTSMLCFGTVATYLVDALPGKGSVGIALNNLVRMILAAVATFVADPLSKAMGVGWLYTMLAIGAYISFSSVICIKIFGPKWREQNSITDLY